MLLHDGGSKVATSAQLDGEVLQEGIFVGLLGSFRVLKAGRAIAIRPGGRSEALLSELALRPRHTAPRASLLAVLWPEADAFHAGQSLSSLVYSLHRLLGDGIGGAAPVVHEDGDYRLNADAGINVDVAEFELLVAEGERRVRAGDPEGALALYHRALGLYRGDLYVSGDLRAFVERERLRAMHLTLLAQLADHYFEAQDYGAALHHARRLLQHDPCREDAYRVVMRCHVRRGERAQALRQYRLCERILQAEFDAPPEPTTGRLYEQVRLSPESI